jgi:DNA repair exonuclease SbcCD ATPase subunit
MKIKIKKIKPRIKYSGSLIQQNFSESLEHGFLVWNANTYDSDFIIIDNDICYYTLEIKNGIYENIPDSLLKKSIRLRVKVSDTDSSVLATIIADIKSKFNIEELTIRKINDFSTSTRVKKINIGDVRDTEYQNDLITKYLKSKFQLDDDILDGIRHVNRTVNSSLPKHEFNRHISWIPKRFEFSNMFSYGIDNAIDFTNMHGVYGIFAPNAAGKSSLLDAISYCIYDKCSRATKAISVLNNKCNSFKCKFNFELDGKDYFIEKIGTKIRGTHVRVDINFYTIDEFGQQESLNGKERSETNDNIRAILGTYENFILTALSIQNNNSGFIDMAQKDRKDLLSQFLDINIFEDLYSIASTEIKDVASVIKDYQRQDFSSQLASAVTAIQKYTTEQQTYTDLKNKAVQKIDELNTNILNLTSQLIPIDSEINDIDVLEDVKVNLQQQISDNELQKTKFEHEQSQLIQRISENEKLLLDFNYENLLQQQTELNILKDQESALHTDVEKLKIDIYHKIEKMKKLEDLKYDENCTFCMNNIFVKDAIQTKSSIANDKQTATNLVQSLEQVKSNISNLSGCIELIKQYNDILLQNQKLNLRKNDIDRNLHEISSKHYQLTAKLLQTEHKIEEYHKKEAAINNNAILTGQINEYTDKLNELKRKLQQIDSNILSIHSNLSISLQNKTNAENSIKRLNNLEQQYKYYQYYLEAVNRDGVPYDLISTSVPYIEQEINNILSQIVDFSLMLEMDGKNINCYIVYDDDNYWPIELTSGMEKFVSSLAIRTALINISALPRPNFLAIDEGLGNLDASVLSDFINMLDYLETQFTFVILISHIDSSRDMTKSSIEITKNNGYSQIVFE